MLRRAGIRGGDILLATTLLLCAAAIAAVFALQPAAHGASLACDGDVIWRATLPAARATYDLECNGRHLTVEVDGGRARIVAADCPDQVCVRTGWLSRSGASAVCIPAGAVLRLEGGGQAVDAILQ